MYTITNCVYKRSFLKICSPIAYYGIFLAKSQAKTKICKAATPCLANSVHVNSDLDIYIYIPKPFLG